MDPEIKKSVDAMDDIPLTVLVPMIDSYMQGALSSRPRTTTAAGRRVDALYTDPPESTEQVLHPTTKLFPTRDHPQGRRSASRSSISPTPRSRTSCSASSQWQIYFQLWLPALERAIASEGWGGDRVTVIEERRRHADRVDRDRVGHRRRTRRVRGTRTSRASRSGSRRAPATAHRSWVRSRRRRRQDLRQARRR